MVVLVSAVQPLSGATAQDNTTADTGRAVVTQPVTATGQNAVETPPVTAGDTTLPATADDAAAAEDATTLADTSGEGPNATLPHDLSPWGMFMAADIVVKTVMIGLALASVATWAILVAKTFELSGAKRRLKKSVRILVNATGLRDADESFAAKVRKGAAVDMIAAAKAELVKSDAIIDHVPADGVKERVASSLSRIEVGAGKRMTAGTGILATIGSISPFVGLFGTVWGIMNSFIGISQSQTTNLAVVAPGIAEALLATAIGLVAAIPAVVIYNYFARSIGGYRQLLGDASAAVERLVSRDLDHHAARRAMPRKADQPHTVKSEASIARIG
ncbi:tonB-system energizer ExbB [Pararhizobium sp.]|uniref:tonB-system energizer ExbB n=1 Tax=Pararhizobium sp. TaxID=1977563 RepID=UPI00271CC380|nr:tonB-system energizer ExbB [Pararhizobium sp.]MDO9417057.1 tonB-system energizer ExbB [Pararhizobium sp.]